MRAANSTQTIPQGPGDQIFEAAQTIACPRADVFAFFSDPANLEKITPPWLGFRIAEGAGTNIGLGSQFAYDLKIHGLPMRWRSLISEWIPGELFMDVQLKGPYARWHHLHLFEDARGGGATVIKDRVIYRLPFAPLGPLLAGRFVRADIQRIFRYRAARTVELLERS